MAENDVNDTINNVSDKLSPKEVKPQSKALMLVICWFLGGFGVHRYLMGYKNWWLMLITLGGCGLWVLYDFIMILLDKMKMADGTDLT
ncbi:TM2 domain-containing protein [Dysgonomonas massiliensis]|uniref:TM2 domain-containing protein n=1 Tax=Dysgonomonas massiliensis TaxID=2040292 RepID=UPI000C775452|nr:TM2 domain-containing protein [Dysgonomonas massiliensis]